jgi:hypothetical protein
VHLSSELQRQLNRLNSPLQLASTIDGILPDRYAFYNKQGRSFRTEFASTDSEFSIVLFERTNRQHYENCFARGLFSNLEKLASVINLWVDKHIDIGELSEQFPELELFKPFSFRHDNPDIEAAWVKVKNMKFNTPVFWRDKDWNHRYEIMLVEAKKHKSFEKYFPFTSHYSLRFSIDKELKETWVLDIYIIPTMYSKEVSESLGKFYVSYNDKPLGGKFFEKVTDALDFYAEKLTEINPTKWTT